MKTIFGAPWVSRLNLPVLALHAAWPYLFSGACFGAALALLVLHACGCNTPADLIVPTGPGTDYPCGVHGRVCKNSMCCGEFDVCGLPDDPSCPAGQCCFYGEDPEFSATRDGGHATEHVRVRGPQRHP
jgi:hypothetical protein